MLAQRRVDPALVRVHDSGVARLLPLREVSVQRREGVLAGHEAPGQQETEKPLGHGADAGEVDGRLVAEAHETLELLDAIAKLRALDAFGHDHVSHHAVSAAAAARRATSALPHLPAPVTDAGTGRRRRPRPARSAS